jgi:hypothetical protein
MNTTFEKNNYMQFKEPVPVKWVAELINARIKGNSEGMVCGINEIHKVEPGDIVFVDHPKYYEIRKQKCRRAKPFSLQTHPLMPIAAW